MSQGGGGKGAVLDVVPAEDKMKTTEPQQVEGARPRMVRIAAEMLDCHACHLPLKQPIFKCEDEHLVCSFCRGVHDESCGRSVAPSTLAETFAAAALVRCDYERYGCDAGYVVYHKAADHLLACPHAPCGCPERGCGFSGSRKNLLKHISGVEHSRTIIVVRYGKPGLLSLPLSKRWQVLVGEEDKDDPGRNAFLVSLTERGAEVEVSLVCIRADAGVPSEFSFKIAVEHSDDGTTQTLESPAMKTSSLSNGAPAPGEVKCLTVKKEYLSGDVVPITILIDRLALAQPPPFSPNISSPFSPKPPPYSPARTFSPMSPPFSPKPSPKRPFSPNPPIVASPVPPPVAALGEKSYKRTRKGT